MTRNIIKAVLKSDYAALLINTAHSEQSLGGVRAIIAKGWSSRMNKLVEPDIEFPPECYPVSQNCSSITYIVGLLELSGQLEKVPHE